MCGIIGIIAKESASSVGLVEGLRRLEYRGYDSAGIAHLVDGRIERRRAEGKLADLVSRLDARAGAGHDRHRPYALGDAWSADRDQRPPDRHRSGRGRPQRHHRELPGACGRSSTRARPRFHTDTDTEAVAIWRRISSTRGCRRNKAVAKTLAR